MQTLKSTIGTPLLSTDELEWLPIGEVERTKARARALTRAQAFDLTVSVGERVEAHARGAADRVAVSDDRRSLTYSQLVAEVRALAQVMGERVSERPAVIAVGGPRCAWSAVALLAIERIGAIYLPVDQNWPALRIREVLENSAASLLIFTGNVDPASSVAIAAEAVHCPIVPVFDVARGTGGSWLESAPLAPDSPRYVLYTSGSTGKPKGAVVEHQGMMNHLWSKVADLDLTEADCVAQVAPLSFDISIWQILAALLAGGRVCMLSDEDAREPGPLIDAVEANGVTVLEVVPTLLRFVLDEHERRKTSAAGSLRCLMATGEALPPSTARRWIAQFPGVPLVNAYGPTECSDDVTHHVVTAPAEDQLYTPIGTPVPNTDLYVLAQDGETYRACDRNEPGELFVGGVCVGRGYFADPDRTRAAFFRDPFSTTKTGRLYRTGDIVRLLDSGVLEYIGRIDRQVKVGGVRIELGEVEEVLRRHESITAAAVVTAPVKHQRSADAAQRSQEQTQRLVAYVCGDDVDIPELKEYLAERLPRTMVPQSITRLRDLPVTANGKIDHKRLELLASRAHDPARTNGAAPATHASIGRPISNTRMYILDKYREPVPIGVTGELYIGGAGVARGYLNRPELTAARFIPSPFVAGDRLYMTGDRARFRPDGTIEYVGRDDLQIWIHGHRVELSEIESRLTDHELLHEAVVLVREDELGEKRLVAYYTSRDAREIDAEKLRAHLLAALPAYMVPAAYVFIEANPSTSTGKLDRKALAAPDANGARARLYEPPLGEIEETIARIWTDVLGVDRIGRGENFFELGGYSVLMMAIAGLLKMAGFTVTLGNLYEYQTVTELAAFLQHPPGGELELGVVTVRAGGTQRPLFLVPEWSGLDTYYYGLTEHVDASIPVYGLLCLELGQPHPQTMEALASHLIRNMRTVQSSGPYRIAGWSWGGTLAYEIATQLLGQDDVVEFLGLFDTEPTACNAALRNPGPGTNANARLLDQLCATPGLDDRQKRDLSKLRDVADRMAFADFVQEVAAIDKNLMPPGSYDLERTERYFARSAAHANAARTYVEQPISVPIHVFVAQDQHIRSWSRPIEEVLGWIDILPQRLIRTSIVPGDHQSIMGAHVGALGAALSAALNAPRDVSPRVSEERYEPVITIRSASPHAPSVYCVPGAGDSATQFIGLANALGSSFCVQGLQYRGLDYVSVPHSTVEAAATLYVRAIEEMPSRGPVHLIGHSFGGWIAFEMAEQLRARGRAPSSLTIIDSEAPTGASHLGKEWTGLEAMREWIMVLELAIGETIDIDVDALGALELPDRLRLVHDRLVRAGLMPRRSRPEALRGAFRTFCTALRTPYRPRQVCRDRAHMVLVPDTRLDAMTNRSEHGKVLREWRRWIPDLAEWYGPGNHMTILRSPHVEELADWWLENVARELGAPEKALHR